MKLERIRIKNFRSIDDQQIEFTENCLGLIGLNESGKSNILSAIRIFENGHVISPNDKSKITGQSPEIYAEFSLNQDDIAKIESFLKSFLEKITTDEIYSFTLPKDFTIKKRARVEEDDSILIQYIYETLIKVNFPLLKSNGETPPPGSNIEIKGVQIPIEGINLVDKNLVPEELNVYFKEYDLSDLEVEFDEWLPLNFPQLSPQVIFWEYNTKYLVPSEITYEDLVAGDKPSENSAPLFNIFLLSHALKIKSVEDLKKKISRWKIDSSERLKDSSIINTAINEYIKKIWVEYDQDLNVGLEETKITIHINDPASAEKNFYAMEARSQGFKTFISFILTIAAEAENGVIDNYILLLDEPETHLHPSGVRYMKEELLKLGATGNYIIFSTHSIFMIDRSKLSRHIKVEKTSEITKLIKIQRNNFIQETVLFEAMGTRVDEFSFGAKNIILEGDLDLILFEFLTELYNEELKPAIKDAQVFNGGGTASITSFLKSKILPYGSHWTVILDIDAPGRNLAAYIKEQFEKHPHLKVTSFHYSTIPNYELEDILPRSIVKQAFDKVIQVLELPNLHGIDISDETKTVSNITNQFLARPPLSSDIKSKFEESFKNEVAQIVTDVLTQISVLEGREAKLAKFIELFPKYYESLEKVILKIPSKTVVKE